MDSIAFPLVGFNGEPIEFSLKIIERFRSGEIKRRILEASVRGASIYGVYADAADAWGSASVAWYLDALLHSRH